MASGYIFYYLKYNKGKYNNPKEDIKKRFKRLIIPSVGKDVKQLECPYIVDRSVL